MRYASLVVCCIALSLFTVRPAKSAVVVTAETSEAAEGGAAGDPFVPSYPSGGPSSSDLLQGALPSAAVGNFTLEESAGPVALTDGVDNTVFRTNVGATEHFAYATAGDGSGAGTSLTYALGGLFDISSLVIYGGWNDSGRDAQHYNVSTSTDGGVTYDLLLAPGTTETFNNGTGSDVAAPIGHRTAFTENSLPNLVEGITHLKLDFLAVENGYSGYTEIDLFGTRQDTPGDADFDNDVDINDFNVIANNFLSVPSSVRADGDLDSSGFVDAADFRIWKDIAPAALVAQVYGTAVPEPATLSIAAVALALGCRLRRRS